MEIKPIPSFDEFLIEGINESLTFDEIKDKFTENPYGIGAQSVEFVKGERGNSNRLIFRHDSSSRRDEIMSKLRAFGVPAKKLSKSTADKAYKYRYELYLFEGENPEAITESVYPDNKGNLNSYDKKVFTEVGRWTVKIGNGLAAIFLFGVQEMNWKGVTEYQASVTCTTYSIDSKNLGNSNGSIIFSQDYSTKEEATQIVEKLLKDMSYKSTRA
jgi:hypothetical protein